MKRFNLTSIFIVLVAFVIVTGASSCAKNTVHPNSLNADQLVSGRLSGTWAAPRDIVTPESVPADVFGSMRLVFTTDQSGNPANFIAQNCPIVFTNATSSAWQITGTTDNGNVKLAGVGPVDEFTVQVSSNIMTISFYMGWENTETKATGKGNFKVTLARQ